MLDELDVVFLERPSQQHGVLVVDVVIGNSVIQHPLLLAQIFNSVTGYLQYRQLDLSKHRPGGDKTVVVSGGVVLSGWESHVSLSVDTVVQQP